MSLYVIGDLHLSFGTDKPMDIFSGWTNYLERLEENWQNKVKPEDTVVIAGDVSWGNDHGGSAGRFSLYRSVKRHKNNFKRKS